NGVVQRPADRQRRRSVRRLQAVGSRARAGTRGAGGVPGDQARPRRDRDHAEGMVVSLFGVHGRRAPGMSVTTEAKTLDNYIGGGWVAASAAEALDDIDPATAEVTAQVPLSGAADVDA